MKYYFDEHLHYLSLYNLRRLGLSVLSAREGQIVPSRKVTKDILKAKKENDQADKFIKKYIEENEYLDQNIPF